MVDPGMPSPARPLRLRTRALIGVAALAALGNIWVMVAPSHDPLSPAPLSQPRPDPLSLGVGSPDKQPSLDDYRFR